MTITAPPFFKARHPDLVRDMMGIRSYEHRGFYFTLLLAYWANCEAFADEFEAKKTLQIHGKKWLSFLPIFRRLFSKKDDEKWHHDGLDAQLQHIEITSKARREAGRKGNEILSQMRTQMRTQMRMQMRPENVANANANGLPNPVNLELYPETTEVPKPRPRARQRHIPGKIEGGVQADIKAKGTPPPATPERSYTPVVSTPRQARMMSNAKANLDCKVARFIEHIGGPKAVAQYWEQRNGPDPAAAQEVLDSTVAAMRASGWEDVG